MSLNTSKREIKNMSTPIPVVDLFGFNSSNSDNNAGDLFGSSSNDVRCSSDPFGSISNDTGCSNPFSGKDNSVKDDLFGGEDSKSCFSTPKRLTRQNANPPSLKKKKSNLYDMEEYTLESPEGKEILNDPGEVKEVGGKTIVFNRTSFNLRFCFQEAYIVLPDTNPLTNTVKAMYNNLMKQRETSRNIEDYYTRKINNVQKHGLETLAKQEYMLKKKHAHKDYSRKRRRITTNLNDEFTKATGYNPFTTDFFK